MPNQLAVGAAGGSLSTFVLSLLRNCPGFNLDWENYSQLIILGAGIALGLGLGFLLDLLWVVKERWRRFVLRRLAISQSPSSNRPLHKVLHE